MGSPTRLIDTLPPAKRSKSMEILALGFSRTGTMSLKTALEKLGYSVYHMSEACMKWREKHLQLWEEALKAKFLGEGKPWTGEDFEKILQDYSVIEDIPCIMFVDELLEMYPDAKVILTNRDIDSWHNSMNQTFFKVLGWKSLPFIVNLDPVFWGPYSRLLNIIVAKWTDGDSSNGAALRESYTEHYAHIRAKVPKDRLLEFKSQDGWVPLCKFLGKELPKGEPYPRTNDAKWTVRIHNFLFFLRLWQCTKLYVGAAAALLVALGLGFWLLKVQS